MNLWSLYPFLRLIIPFVLGIALGINGISPPRIVIYLILSGLFFLIPLYLIKAFHNAYYRMLTGFLVLILFFLAGWYWVDVRDMVKESEELSHKEGAYFLVWKTETKRSDSLISGYGDLQSYLDPRRFQKVKVRLEFRDGKTFPQYGDVLLLRCRFNEIQKPVLDGGFDYASFLRRKGIRYSSMIKSGEWLSTGIVKGNCITRISRQWQENICASLRKYIPTRENAALVEALVFGRTIDMDDDTNSDFRRSGTLHVLSVSGLHVGLLCFILQYLLNPFLLIPGGKWIRLFIVLGSLWFYAFLTGLSPSVMRSASMFTFMLLGGVIGRSSPALNTLGVSAFFMLVADPFLLGDVGFQLSYLSMFGILWIHPILKSFYEAKSSLGSWCWELCCASVSAQVITLPLTVYYFRQVPLYFLFANLVIIPLSTVLLYTGILFGILSWIPLCGEFLGWILEYLALSLRWCADWFGGLPASVIPTPAPGIPLVFLLLICSCFLFAWLESRDKDWIRSFLVALNLIFMLNLAGLFQKYKRREVFLISNRGSNYLGFTEGRRGTVFVKGRLDKFLYAQVKAHLSFHEVNDVRLFAWEDQGVPVRGSLLRCGDHIIFDKKIFRMKGVNGNRKKFLESL